MTPAEVADLITERVTDVDAVAAERYPNNPAARREDVVAQLRLLVETAAEHLRQIDRDREQLVDEIARVKAAREIDRARSAHTKQRLRRRIRRANRSRAALRATITRLEIAS